MADISSLAIAPNDPLNLDEYPVAGGGNTFPRKGRYTLRAPDSFPSEAFAPNKAGTALTIAIDPTIVGPTAEGKVLKFTRISCKTFTRGKGVASQLGDYLKACGISGAVPGDPQALADIAESTAGSTYEANLDWRLYAKGFNADGTDLIIEGMENFPKNEAGEYVSYVDSPRLLTDEGKPKRFFANLVIPMGGFIPAV